MANPQAHTDLQSSRSSASLSHQESATKRTQLVLFGGVPGRSDRLGETILGAPYYDYSIEGPKTLCQLLKALIVVSASLGWVGCV